MELSSTLPWSSSVHGSSGLRATACLLPTSWPFPTDGQPSRHLSTLGQDHTLDLEEHGNFEETVTDGILAVPGAAEILNVMLAQNHPWALVTSAWRKLAETRVLAAGLPLPTVIVPIDEIKNGKPDPEGFLEAAAQLGVRPEDCAVFEDTRPGIDAGLRAGMQVVALLTTCPPEQLQHTPMIRDFREVQISSDEDFLKIKLADWDGNARP